GRGPALGHAFPAVARRRQLGGPGAEHGSGDHAREDVRSLPRRLRSPGGRGPRLLWHLLRQQHSGQREFSQRGRLPAQRRFRDAPAAGAGRYHAGGTVDRPILLQGGGLIAAGVDGGVAIDEVFPVLAGVIVGLVIPTAMSPSRLRWLVMGMLSVVLGAVATWISGELAISAVYLLIDIA